MLSVLLLTLTSLAEMRSLTFDFAICTMRYDYLKTFPAFSVRCRLESGKMQE